MRNLSSDRGLTRAAGREQGSPAGRAAQAPDHPLQHSPALLAQRQRIISAFGPAAQLEMSDQAKGYIDAALATNAELAPRLADLGLAANTYAAASARLKSAEKTELEELWTAKGSKGNTKNRDRIEEKRKAGGLAVAKRLVDMLETVEDAVAYANNFAAKHTHDGDVDSAKAVEKGDARDPKPPWNTVFKKLYLETKVRDHAEGEDDGNYEIVQRASEDGAGNIALAELRDNEPRYKQAVLGIYQYRLSYSVATSYATRMRTITLSHMETA